MIVYGEIGDNFLLMNITFRCTVTSSQTKTVRGGGMEDGKKEVIKHSAAIQIHNNITLLQRRAWNILLANAYDELPTKEEHSITLVDLIRKLEFDSKNEDYLRESLIALITCAVEWNILGKIKGRDGVFRPY